GLRRRSRRGLEAPLLSGFAQTVAELTPSLATLARGSLTSYARLNRCLVNREAIQQTGSTCGHEILLAATTASMRGIPRTVSAALLVGMAKLDLPSSIRIARVIAAGVIHCIRISAAIRLRARQNIVRVGHVADAIDDSAFFSQRKLFTERVA